MDKHSKINGRTVPAGKTQVNFNLENELLDKVKNLAYREGVANSVIYNRGMANYFKIYERKFGKIKPRPAGKGLELT